MSEGVQLVVAVVPTERDDRYNAIKQLCYIDSPVGSQVIKSRTLSQPQKYVTNVAVESFKSLQVVE